MRVYRRSSILLVLIQLLPVVVLSFPVVPQPIRSHPYNYAYASTSVGVGVLKSSALDIETLGANLEAALETCRSEVAKTCKVGVSVSANNRLGLIATAPIRKGEVVLSIPYDERFELSGAIARKIVFKDVLANDYEGWTGDAGLIALLLLNEVARASAGDGDGIPLPKRSEPLQAFCRAWVQALPAPDEMTEHHPILWSEGDQEVLQSSSSTKIYKVLDDLEEDATWLIENVFQKDRTKFPETVSFNGREIPCFSAKGYQWAMALTQSRSIFVDGALRILPILDMCNHEDDADEINGGTMGTFGTTKGAQLVSAKRYNVGDEVCCSYGPKSAADYLLEHGFVPPQAWKTAVSEITLDLLEAGDQRFSDDKLDILQFETYDQGQMDPTQSFDVVSAFGRDGAPDPAMIQFARFCKLGGTDAFLLEAIFRKEVWGFMAMPVSERNEFAVVTWIIQLLQTALEELDNKKNSGPEVCTKLRESETKALTRTLEFLLREKEALDLKEYYQERRLKDLGLDSDWSQEEDIDMSSPDLGFGQTRVPGGADYDW